MSIIPFLSEAVPSGTASFKSTGYLKLSDSGFDASTSRLQEVFSFTRKSANGKINIVYFRLAVGGDVNGRSVSENSTELPKEEKNYTAVSKAECKRR